MNRYSRRPSRRFHTGPLVAFLLVASFGILFAGCGNGAIRGPEDTTDDLTFTEEDLARFQRLASDDPETGTGAAIAGDDGETASLPDLAATGTGSSSLAPVLDLTMVQRYNALRSTGGGDGKNVYQVTNSFLNVRTEPRATAALVQRLNGGDTVTVSEFTNAGWAKLQLADGKTGFAALQYLGKLTSQEKLAEEQKAFDGLYYVHFGFVNVRAAANQQSEKIGEIPGQAFVRPLSVENQWARVSFQGKEGYVSMQYLAPFKPVFLTRQEKFVLPILRYRIGQTGIPDTLAQHIAGLKQAGVTFLTFRDLQSILLQQESRKDVRIPAKAVLIAVTDVTPQTVKPASDILYGANVPASFFLQTKNVGLQGITQKALLTLVANGFDIQSAGHSGDDLRALTNAQVKLEVEQSRKILEDWVKRPVFTIDYPQGGVNDRVAQVAADAGYLFGVANAPEKEFLRSQFLRLPSYNIVSGMTVEDVLGTMQ
ncbi:MAG: SH3 domain-containing protein [Candidatus Peribacteraceae bacterium]|nr:SH3 domain-containing protein [Candidatus Peribacteraceae bacterium]